MAVALRQRLIQGTSALSSAFTPVPPRQSRSRLSVLAERSDDGTNRPRSSKGKAYRNSKRRKGRPAHTRSPYDSPLRDGNRDRLIGLLTERAAKTLLCYLMETNLNVYHWLLAFLKENPIPRDGNWDDVSGETFLRTLLSMPIEVAKFETGRDAMFDNIVATGVDPRSIAQRLMEIRSQLSKEFIQELNAVDEENSTMLRETLHNSFLSSKDLKAAFETPSLKLSTPAAPGAPAAPAPADAAAPQLPPDVEALIKAAYPGGATPETMHPEILELLQQSAPPAAPPAAPAAAAADAAAPAPPAAASPGASPPAAAVADDLVASLDGGLEAAGGSSEELVITNVAGQKVVLGSGDQAADKVVAAAPTEGAAAPPVESGSVDGAAGDADAGSA